MVFEKGLEFAALGNAALMTLNLQGVIPNIDFHARLPCLTQFVSTGAFGGVVQGHENFPLCFLGAKITWF